MSADALGVTKAAVAHPFVADLDEDTLRAELLHVMRRLLELPD